MFEVALVVGQVGGKNLKSMDEHADPFLYSRLSAWQSSGTAAP